MSTSRVVIVHALHSERPSPPTLELGAGQMDKTGRPRTSRWHASVEALVEWQIADLYALEGVRLSWTEAAASLIVQGAQDKLRRLAEQRARDERDADRIQCKRRRSSPPSARSGLSRSSAKRSQSK